MGASLVLNLDSRKTSTSQYCRQFANLTLQEQDKTKVSLSQRSSVNQHPSFLVEKIREIKIKIKKWNFLRFYSAEYSGYATHLLEEREQEMTRRRKRRLERGRSERAAPAEEERKGEGRSRPGTGQRRPEHIWSKAGASWPVTEAAVP